MTDFERVPPTGRGPASETTSAEAANPETQGANGPQAGYGQQAAFAPQAAHGPQVSHGPQATYGPQAPYAPQAPYGPRPPYAYAPVPVPPSTNNKAIAALVLGILAIVVPFAGMIIGVVAIVFAGLALKELKYFGGQGRGLAFAGLICGIIGTVLYSLVLAVIYIIAIIYADPTLTDSGSQIQFSV